MPRPTCREDGYEYRVKVIFKKLRKLWREDETDFDFEDWLDIAHMEVANEFLNDVAVYMGIPEEE